jgi:hypothetical protein
MIKEWAMYLGILFGIAGAGYGVLFLIADAIDEPIFSASSSGFSSGAFGALIGQLTFFTSAVALCVAAVFVGVWLAGRLNEADQTVFKVAGATAGAGAAIFLLLSTILISLTMDNASLEFGGLLINTIVSAIFIAGIAVGGVWAARNQAPA